VDGRESVMPGGGNQVVAASTASAPVGAAASEAIATLEASLADEWAAALAVRKQFTVERQVMCAALHESEREASEASGALGAAREEVSVAEDIYMQERKLKAKAVQEKMELEKLNTELEKLLEEERAKTKSLVAQLAAVGAVSARRAKNEVALSSAADDGAGPLANGGSGINSAELMSTATAASAPLAMTDKSLTPPRRPDALEADPYVGDRVVARVGSSPATVSGEVLQRRGTLLRLRLEGPASPADEGEARTTWVDVSDVDWCDLGAGRSLAIPGGGASEPPQQKNGQSPNAQAGGVPKNLKPRVIAAGDLDDALPTRGCGDDVHEYLAALAVGLTK